MTVQVEPNRAELAHKTASVKPAFIHSWRLGIIKSDLPPTTRHLLLTLSVRMDKFGSNCFPSIETLCKETGLSNRSVIDHLRLAERSGWLVVAKRGFVDRRWSRNEYSAALPSQEGSERGSPPYQHEAVNLVQEGSEPGDKEAVNEVHTNYSVELSREVVYGAGKPAPCPRNELFRIWNECVSSCPRVSEISWSQINQRRMERCWRKKPDLSWWADLFAKIANTPRLTGVDEIRPGRGLFWATLRWLVVESNFSDVVDGIYSVDVRLKNSRRM